MTESEWYKEYIRRNCMRSMLRQKREEMTWEEVQFLRQQLRALDKKLKNWPLGGFEIINEA